jgi:hypothetical protein
VTACILDCARHILSVIDRLAFGRVEYASLPKLLKLVLVLALMARGMLPVGFMLSVPGTADGGLMTVVICSPDGTHSITVDENGRPVAPTKAPDGNIHLCTCVLAGGPALCAPRAIAIANELHVGAVAYWSPRRSLSERARAGSHSARGPPFTAST